MNLPLGYKYATTYAGIRKDNRDDLGLIVSAVPAAAAVAFTQNRVQAAPVTLGRKHLKRSGGRIGAVVINAGNANCATRTGERVALECCRAVARALRMPIEQVLPSSTGVIGVELDAKLIVNALPRLVENLSEDRFEQVAQAIMTTDTVPKTASAVVETSRGVVRIAGLTKGAGMIQPLMATTLGFVMTDANIALAKLRPMMTRLVEQSYNRLSVDGDTSTNDTLALLANGTSGVAVRHDDLVRFEQAALEVVQSLARQIARDGEGARKLVTIVVTGAATEDAAVRIARAIANSPLVKTAIAGADPNWGRIISAAGNSGAVFDPRKADIDMQGVPVCRGGLAADFSEDDLKFKLGDRDCRIDFRIRGGGKGSAEFWTCDLTEDYIRINASYRT